MGVGVGGWVGGFEVSGDFSSFRVLGGFLDGNMGKLVEIYF